jgi:hypothetical protein
MDFGAVQSVEELADTREMKITEWNEHSITVTILLETFYVSW